MSMTGELTSFLRLQIKQCKNGTFHNQAKYIVNLLKSFDLYNAKPFGIAMTPSLKLDFNSNGKKVYMTLFKCMIGSLFYLIASKLNIMLNVDLCARYQVNPKESHLSVVKKNHKIPCRHLTLRLILS